MPTLFTSVMFRALDIKVGIKQYLSISEAFLEMPTCFENHIYVKPFYKENYGSQLAFPQDNHLSSERILPQTFKESV